MTATTATAAVAEERFLLVKEVADVMRRPTRTVTRWCIQAQSGQGPLAFGVVRPGRHWLVRATTVADLLNPSRTEIGA